jgi:hypothetical protein
MDAMGVIQHLSGVLVHDGWSSYRKYTAVSHALCNAHHLRELDGVAEVEGQGWATDMVALLADTWHRVLDAKEAGATLFSATELLSIRAAYDTIIAAGHVANPAPPPSGKRGRTKKSKAANLLERLDIYADDVLRFATDFRVSFDNNEAERQVRMVKVQQKNIRWLQDQGGRNRMARGPQLPRHRDEERREPARGDAASHGRRPVDADCSRQRLSDTTCQALQCRPTWSGRLLGPPIRGEQLLPINNRSGV